MNSEVTVLIAARNSETTIARAVASAMKESPAEILLIDDFSEDNTVREAKSVSDGRLRVVSPPKHGTLGFTRQFGLNEVRTTFGILLDSDDEFIEGRVNNMVNRLKEDGTDFVSDGAELIDGATGRKIGLLHIPSFLFPYKLQARLFERNYLPGSGFVGFRTKSALKAGYDTELHGPEDFGFLLRAVARRAGFSLMEDIGYRYYEYPGSISRKIGKQREMYKKALLKHDYENVRVLYKEAGHTEWVTSWGLVFMATYRQEYAMALGFLNEAVAITNNTTKVVEPDGPYPFREDWRIAFHEGTLNLLLGNIEKATASLEKAIEISHRPEAANNLGVAEAKSGNLRKAQTLFNRAAELSPSYLDARRNIENEGSFNITTQPIRHHPTRDRYR